MHAVIVSRLAPTTLQVISSGSIGPSYNKLADPISHYMRPAQPATAPSNRPPGHPQTDSKYIDSYLPGGSLQVAVSEAPLRILPSNGLSIQGRFRYSPRTSGPRQWGSTGTEPLAFAA